MLNQNKKHNQNYNKNYNQNKAMWFFMIILYICKYVELVKVYITYQIGNWLLSSFYAYIFLIENISD